MPARTNKRIFYANQLVAITSGSDGSVTAGDLLHGVNEVGIATNFSNTPYFQMGALEIYEDVEELPDVEVSVAKTFDNRPFIYHQATKSPAVTTPTLIGRSNVTANLFLGLYSDTADFATSTPGSTVMCSGMFISSVQYTFPVDGLFAESVTLVGNNKLWKNDSKIVNASDIAAAAGFSWTVGNQFSGDTPTSTTTIGTDQSIYNLTGVGRRQYIRFDNVNSATTDVNGMRADYDQTILPPDVDGISTSGTNNKSDGTNFDSHVQSINISVDLGRDNLNELGRRGPYHRVAQFPVEVTCAIEVLATSGDMISATENGILSTSSSACAIAGNLSNRTIRVTTCHNEVFYLGTKNKLTSVQYGGGNTDGGNATITYNFRNYNILTVMAVHDPNPNNNFSGGTVNTDWWYNRSTYLVN